MNKKELGMKLKEVYESAPEGKQMINIHLFGIKYAATIRENSYDTEELINIAGISKSLKSELEKGLKLSEFVKLHNF